MKVLIPEDLFETNLKEAKRIKSEIDQEFEDIDSGKSKKDFELVYEEANEKRDNFLEKSISMYSLVPELDKVTKRKDDEQYDVSKIVISTEDNSKFMDYDRELLEIFYKDIYSEKKINSEISMLHLMSGFKVLDTAKQGEIIFEENYIKKFY